ncbi:MAG: hypothetical protein KAS73_07095 [Candidatus Sabulitectum sp.]|nr:hypothetical protein [Candidatus Sabulitectum sp.]
MITNTPAIPIELGPVSASNWVMHGYDKVDDVVIWGIVSNHLPKLMKEIEGLLAES